MRIGTEKSAGAPAQTGGDPAAAQVQKKIQQIKRKIKQYQEEIKKISASGGDPSSAMRKLRDAENQKVQLEQSAKQMRAQNNQQGQAASPAAQQVKEAAQNAAASQKAADVNGAKADGAGYSESAVKAAELTQTVLSGESSGARLAEAETKFQHARNYDIYSPEPREAGSAGIYQIKEEDGQKKIKIPQ